MTQEKKRFRVIIIVALFIIYTFVAASPVPKEMAMDIRWFISTDEEETPDLPLEVEPIPFELGEHFGYFTADGHLLMNRVKNGNLALSPRYWAEYSDDSNLILRDPEGKDIGSITSGEGYPFFIKDRIFLVSSDFVTLSSIDESGAVRWSYDFSAPLTDIDAVSSSTGDIVLAGCLDGTVELLKEGRRSFVFEPGGSRLPLIAACRISADGTKLALISGIDSQRFLFLEGSADTYRVVYHESIGEGFRRPVRLAFVNQDNWVAFEREEGISLYAIPERSREEGKMVIVPIEGAIETIASAPNGYVYILSSPEAGSRCLSAIHFSGDILMQASFKGESTFLLYQNDTLYVGGEDTIASFLLTRK